ncbi:MAG: NADPH-dependent FMN reductase [Gaiellales bacterium]|jgi:chromate reductase
MRVLGISGSLRSGSHNTSLLREAGRHMRDGVEYAIYDGLREIPPYDEDLDAEGTPAAVADLKRAITEADGVLFATPEYNSSIPGQLKNAIDWVSRPFATNPLRNKPVAVIGSSTGMFGAMWAQAELRKVLAATGARVVDAELSVPKAQAHLGEGGSLAPEHDEGLADVVSALLEETRPKVTAAA